jgi:bifunctional DNase/RNase
MFEVNVQSVIREPLTSRYLMMLEPVSGDFDTVIIPVGKYEAENIHSRKCEGSECKKSAFDILSPILDSVDTVKFEKLIIDDCDCGIFTAKLVMDIKGEETVMDCRPSDGVVLALDREIPIFISKVLCPTQV